MSDTIPSMMMDRVLRAESSATTPVDAGSEKGEAMVMRRDVLRDDLI